MCSAQYFRPPGYSLKGKRSRCMYSGAVGYRASGGTCLATKWLGGGLPACTCTVAFARFFAVYPCVNSHPVKVVAFRGISLPRSNAGGIIYTVPYLQHNFPLCGGTGVHIAVERQVMWYRSMRSWHVCWYVFRDGICSGVGYIWSNGVRMREIFFVGGDCMLRMVSFFICSFHG